AGVHRLPDAALRAGGVDDIGVARIGGDRVHAAAHRRTLARGRVGLTVGNRRRTERLERRALGVVAVVLVVVRGMAVRLADRVHRQRRAGVLALAEEPLIERVLLAGAGFGVLARSRRLVRQLRAARRRFAAVHHPLEDGARLVVLAVLF